MATDLEILVGQLPYLPLRQRRPCSYFNKRVSYYNCFTYPGNEPGNHE